MIRKRCNACYGTGTVLNLFDWRNWIPFGWPAQPYARCGICNGRGYYFQEWKKRRWDRR